MMAFSWSVLPYSTTAGSLPATAFKPRSCSGKSPNKARSSRSLPSFDVARTTVNSPGMARSEVYSFRGIFGGRTSPRRRGVRPRQPEHETGTTLVSSSRPSPPGLDAAAVVHHRLAVDGPAVRLRNLLSDRETESRSVRFGREERLEPVLAKRWLDPRSVVLDAQRDTAVVRALHANRDVSSLRHRFARVAKQVQESLTQLSLVGEHGRKLGRDVEGELDTVLLELAPHEIRSLACDRPHVLGLQLERPLAREREILLAEPAQPL